MSILSSWRRRSAQTHTYADSVQDTKRDIVVVLPTLDEKAGISEVLDSLHDALKDYSYEVIAVDGGSKDETIQIAKNMGAIVINQAKRGYGDALRNGMKYATDNFNTKVVVFMDADRTYDPKDISVLAKPIFEGKADLVTGNRLVPMNAGSMRTLNKIGNMFISLTLRMCFGSNVRDACSGMKAMRGDLFPRLPLEVEDWPLMTEILAKARWLGARITEIPIAYHVRLGKSKLPRLGATLDNLGIILKNRIIRKSYLR